MLKRGALHWILAVLAILAFAALALAAPVTQALAAPRDTSHVVNRVRVDDRGVRIESGVPGKGDEVDVKVDVGHVRVNSRGVTRIGPGIYVDDQDQGIVRVFADADVRPGEHVDGDVVAVFGSVTVAGEVNGSVVAVLGSVRLAPEAVVQGDAVAVGGHLDQPPGATVQGESVSIGFLPFAGRGMPGLRALLGAVLIAWVVSLLVGWLLMLVFPTRMLRVATTASERTGWSLLLGLLSGPLLIVAMVLLAITLIGIPVAVVLPLFYVLFIWAGQLATAYLIGCRLVRRQPGEGGLLAPLAAGTLFVAAFFALGAALAVPEGWMRTVALFFTLLGGLLVIGMSMIGTGAVLVSGVGTRPREIEYHRHGGMSTGAGYPPAPAPTPSPVPPPPASGPGAA